MSAAILSEVDGHLSNIRRAPESARGPLWSTLLDRLLSHFDCQVGTIHRLDAATGLLHLIAQRGVPEAILDRVRVIPVGKGMAGLAAERREAVQVCNLQTDMSGQAKPGARQTGMEGSIAAPMLVDGVVRGTLGVAKPVVYEFTDAEKSLLMAIGAAIGRVIE